MTTYCADFVLGRCKVLCRPFCEKYYGGPVPKIEFGIPVPEIVDTEQITRTVPDHEVLLRFVNDVDAQRFTDWLQEPGTWLSFMKYAGEAGD